MTVKFMCCVVAALHIATATEANAAIEIQWRVENPFRLFLDANDTELHRTTFNSLSPAERATPILSAERRLGERFPFGWSQQVFRKTCWSPASQRYACAERRDYAHPESHRVRAELSVADSRQSCRWSISSQSSRIGQSITASCSQPVLLDIPYPGPSRVSVSNQGRELASVDIGVRDVFILGLGDSFAAGDGNPDVPVLYDDNRSVSYRSDSKHNFDGYPARSGSWRDIGDSRFQLGQACWIQTITPLTIPLID